MADDKFHSTWVRQIGEMSNPFSYELPMKSAFVKYALIFWNSLLFVFGVILMVSGFAVTAEYALNGEGFSEIIDHKYISLPLFIGIVGILVSIVTFFGCYGSIKESQAMTVAYVVLLTVIMITVFIGGIVGYVYRDSVDDYVEKMLGQSLRKWCTQSQGPWKTAQQKFECCGVRGVADWRTNNTDFEYWAMGNLVLSSNQGGVEGNNTMKHHMREYPVPDSCCNLTYINSVKSDPKYPDFMKNDLCGIVNITDIKDFNEKSVYQNGCLKQVEGAIEKHLGQVAGAAVGISVFSLLVICLSCCLSRQYSKKSEAYNHMQ